MGFENSSDHQNGKEQFSPEQMNHKNLCINQKEGINMLKDCSAETNTPCYPLSSAEQRMHVIYQLEPDSLNYNMPAVLKIHGQIDRERFRDVFKTLIQRHEALRTSFTLVNGEPVQRVHQNVDFTMPFYRVHSAMEFEELLQKLIQPFDLAEAPLMRNYLIDCCGEQYLIMDLHHIIADGFSMGILAREFEYLYKGQHLPELKAQYRDYRIWQKTFFNSEKFKRQEAFWLATFSDEIPVMNLPLDAPRGVERDNAGDVVRFVLDQALVTELRRFAATQKMTVYMLLFAVYNLLLERYTGQEDLVVGTPVAGRSHPAFHGVIGMFVNTLAVRTRLKSKETVSAYLQRVKANLLAVFENQDYPFERLVDRLGVASDPSRNPLFDAFFSLQWGEDVKADFSGFRFEQMPFNSGVAKFDLSLDGTAFEGQIEFLLEYCSGLFSREKMEQFARHFQNLLGNVMTAPDRRLDELTLLSQEEKRQIVTGFNQVTLPYPAEALVHQIFEQQVQRTPERVALRYHEQVLTYAELNAAANRLARILREKGVGPEKIVALLLAPCPGEIIAMLAVLKAGGAYLPIDTANPPERLTFLLADSDPVLLLTTAEKLELLENRVGVLANSLTSSDADDNTLCKQLRNGQTSPLGVADFQSPTSEERFDPALEGTRTNSGGMTSCSGCSKSATPASYEVLDISDPRLFTGDPANLPEVTQPENLAYIIYTSGSTGRPKGVMVEHRNLVAYASSFAQQFSWKPDDVCIHVTSYSFDACVDELFHLLFIGGSVVLLDKEEILDVPHLAQVITENQVTIFSSTPLLINELNKLAPLPTVHTFLSGGDLLKPEYISNLIKDASVYNLYGPTETTVTATGYKCFEPLSAHIPVGQPYPNYPVYILNPHGEPVPVGVEGEICISGVGVARGYLNRPELTAEKFVPDPFQPGLRMYRTGDLGRWRADGMIEFVGRVDYQIKIRGYRIEPGEIEQRLIMAPGVADAIVVERQDGTGQSYLCAYIVPERERGEATADDLEQRLSITDLKSYLGKVLPEYMIPARFMLIDTLPLSATGKVDRKRLPVPQDCERTTEYLAPATLTEVRLAEIWRELLGVSEVGRKDHFFALGGHSLKATALVVRIFQMFHVEIPLRSVFAAPILEELAALVERTGKSQYRAITPAPQAENYPASSAQKRLYILQQYEGIGTTYNLPGMFRIEGILDRERLTDAIQKLVQRHEAFRTSFVMVDGVVCQNVVEEVTLAIDYRKAEEGEWAALAHEFIQPFDLTTAPLARVGLIESPESACLIFDMHHIISDAVSFNILLTDFVALYQGDALEPLPIQYKDFAAWQNEYFLSEDLQLQEQYWLHLFEGEVPVLNLPTDYNRPTVQSFAGERVQFQLDREMIENLQGLMQRQGATLYMTLLAAYNVLLAKYSGQEDLVVGTPVAGRDYPGLEKILGMFVNTLAMRNYPAGEKTFVEFLSEVRENALRAYENQDYPFELLVERLDVRRNVARNPLFDTVLVLQNADEGELAIPGLTFRPLQIENNVSRFDMTWMVEEGDSLSVIVEYSTKLFRRETITRMARHFTNVLRTVATNPDLALREIELLSPEEKAYLLTENGLLQVEFPREKTVQQLFEEQVLRTPERIALRFGDASMTYRELNARANRLARVLRAKGAGPDLIIGLLVERSMDLLIAILAIVKAGGAYLPLDPAYPPDRLAYMLQDSAAKILLTDQAELPVNFTGEILHLADAEIYRVRAEEAARLQNAGRRVDAVSCLQSALRMLDGASSEHGGDAISRLQAKNEVFCLQNTLCFTDALKQDATPADGEDGIDEFMIDEFFNDALDSSPELESPEMQTFGAEQEESSNTGSMQPEVGASGSTQEHFLAKGEVAITTDAVDWDGCTLITDESNLENINLPGDLLYIIYTSGSTGKPKGVMIEHRNLVRLMFNDRFQFDFTENDVWTMFHSDCFDFSVWEMYGALLYGGKLVVVPKVTAQNPAEFLQLLRAERVTVLNQTPTAFYKLQEEEMQAAAADLAVRYIIFGGEALKPLKLAEWHAKYPATRLINMYGITETTVHVTYKEITGTEIRAGVSNIGKPIPTLTTYILNRDQKLVPVGVSGELCVGGLGLARGYLNRPELTAEKFIAHPYIPGERLYRSGDLGRLLSNGEIEYLGRIDQQVKIRGFRIELGEIESKLLQHVAVTEVVVLDYKDSEGQSYLVAYLVTERELSITEVREHLKTSLPDYMVPAYFIRLDELPLTSNGKLNRAALPRPESQVSGRDYIAPVSETEARLVLIWQEVLDLQQVGRDDDFFELGGHSLKATTMIQKVKKEFQVEIPLKEIFKTPGLKELAQMIDRTQRSQFSAIEPLPSQKYYPVSAVQKRIYLYHQIHGANTVYNISDALLIDGVFDRERFRAALEKVVQRHEAFRTSFMRVGEEIVQMIAPTVELPVVELDLSGVQPEQLENLWAVGQIEKNSGGFGGLNAPSQLLEQIRNFIQPFDLSQAPLLRVGLGKFGARDLLVFDMHHIIADGTSMSILVADFLKAYAGEELPPLRVQYKDFASWQNHFFTSEAFQAQEAYWSSVFAEGVPVLQLPLDYERPATLTSAGDTVRFQLAKEDTGRLYELAETHEGTLFMVLLAAFSILLAKYSGQSEIVTGTPVAGRSHADLEEMIGMFVNTLALKTRPEGEKTFQKYLAEVREITLQAYENQDYQLEMYLERSGLHVSPNRTPLFDVLLVLQNMGRNVETGSLTLRSLQLDNGTAKFDLSLYVVEGDGLQCTLDYRVHLFKRETMELFAERLVQLLREIAQNPEKRIAELCGLVGSGGSEDLSDFMDDLEDEF